MKLISILACLFALSAWAAGESPKVDTANPYASVVEWFDKGQELKLSDIKSGVTEGHCFSWRSPYARESHMLVLDAKKVDDRGPGFKPRLIGRVGILSADRKRDLSKQLKKIAEAKSFEIGLESEDLLQYKQDDIKGVVRKFDKYYVTVVQLSHEFTCEADETVCVKDEKLKAESPLFACYFHKKVR